MREFIPETARTIPEEAECKFRGGLFDVYQWPQELFDGSIATFEMLKRQDTVQIIAIKDNKIIVTYQTQPRQGWFYDYPGGRHDNPEENELDAAKRELREETGMSFREWRLIDVRQPFTKLDWLVYTFLALDFEGQGEQELDAGEMIKVEEMTFEELVKCSGMPNAKHLLPEFVRKAGSIEGLEALPSLYRY